MNAEQFMRWWICFGQEVHAHLDDLNELDRAIGDGDHGTNMDRGLSKVRELWSLPKTPVENLLELSKTTGMTLLSTVGGASGALWGSAMVQASQKLPVQGTCTTETQIAWLDAIVASMENRGKARIGDKTMIDVLRVGVDILIKGDPPSFSERLNTVASSAREWSEATRSLIAKRGRAAYLGERSQGHVDPGSFSAALWWECLNRAMGE
ncbi:MAG: dihydroxyacetone kinase subunit DhaL [Firmicutes bacterium]|jgi:dihydroxyacetone kinase-like protein|uniref:phosphoenolpyruvate--glycerone phosphotransferase n=1 Tax=Sulfobacillus benefaciens TaxID=453960 RepID=A0A2T2X498_9FIRM|nr:dihydroxyacetone kinase subunit DhaL [Bacillota bacterium]MCL5013958.1 dihydroxyacetone kinase subunit DhaL [Bacillota bacterium]PSR29321.1 MAG: dihydroxyacetone kinase subunit L [Sulfobacillus benefaciens]